jgi:hypothetical protein
MKKSTFKSETTRDIWGIQAKQFFFCRQLKCQNAFQTLSSSTAHLSKSKGLKYKEIKTRRECQAVLLPLLQNWEMGERESI